MKTIIETVIETITPNQAKAYLKANTHNRVLRQDRIDLYTNEIRAGRWRVTHQGIAFDDEGTLIDGQHRLLAIIKADRPIKIQVTRGIPKSDGGLFAQDLIDVGGKRSVADSLHLSHGVHNANVVSGVANAIVQICAPSTRTSSVGLALAVLRIYGPSIHTAIQLVGNFKPAKKSPIIATIAFAMQIDPNAVSLFACQISRGEDIRVGDPAFCLREYMINRGLQTGRLASQFAIECVANSIYNAIHGNQIKLLKAGSRGINWLRDKQRGSVQAIREAAGLK